MTAELRNYLSRCSNPLFALSAASALARRALAASISRVWPNCRRLYQPSDVKKTRRKLLRDDEAGGILHSPPSQVSRGTLSLAVGTMDFDGHPEWSREFPDEEVTVSLHRWNWLLRGLTDAEALSRQQGIELMRSWIGHCYERSEYQTDAYSTGERIVNGSLFLLRTGDEELPADISAALRGMGRHVASNLEYYPSGLTGNHAFNNARALLFAGLVAKLPSGADLALAIAKERLPKLVTPDGFMREGSSHYHFLFSRWVLEMLWLARRSGESAFVQLLVPYAALLVRRCWFFLVYDEVGGHWTIPLIGDVSPDCLPEWLVGLPWTDLACELYRPETLPEPPRRRGWQDMFGSVEGHGFRPRDEIVSFPKSSWHRVDHQPWTVLLRAQGHDAGIHASHWHHDLGGFVLFYKGAQVLIDSGRLDYTCSPLSRYGKSAEAHNVLLVDGLGAASDGPSWLAARYVMVKVDVQARREGKTTLITIRHDGFARIAGSHIVHQRCLKLDDSGFSIEDSLDGSDTHRVHVRFHFAPDIDVQRVTQRAWRLGESELKFVTEFPFESVVQVGQIDPPSGGLLFPAYGAQRVTKTLDLSGTVKLPAICSYALIQES